MARNGFFILCCRFLPIFLLLLTGAACSGSSSSAATGSCGPWDGAQENEADQCRLVLDAGENVAALDINHVAYSADGETISMLSYFLEQRDAQTGDRLTDCEACRERKLHLSGAVLDDKLMPLALSSGHYIYAGPDPLDTPAGGEHGPILDMAYAPAMGAILVAHSGGIAWRGPDGSLLADVPLQQTVRSVAVSPDDLAYAVALADGSIILQPFEDGAASLSLEEAGTPSWSLAYSPDGRLLASGDEIGQIFLWETDSGALIRKWPAHSERVDTLQFSPQGDALASGSIDSTAVVWSLDEPLALHSWQHRGHGVRDLAFSPDGSELAVALGNQVVDNLYDNERIDGDEVESEQGQVVIWRIGE